MSRTAKPWEFLRALALPKCNSQEEIHVKKAFLAIALALALAGGVQAGQDHDDDHPSHHFEFKPGTIVLSRSVYAGTASTITVGQTLPPGCVKQTVTLPLLAGGTTTVKVSCSAATADGTYPTVFNNNLVDGSFGITSPIFLDDIADDGKLVGTLPIPSDQIVTSFSSKSELALNRSTDKKTITFVGYRGGPEFLTVPNQLDVSNSNTPGVVDPTNPVTSQYYRAVAEVDADGHLQITEGNAYSGNNGRAAIKSHWMYYMSGNDNNGGLSRSQLSTTQVGVDLVNSTGAELLVPGQTPPVPPNITMIGDFEVTQVIDPSTGSLYTAADKPGKDNNFRGLTIHDNTMYVSKGSGGNGVNTVYQVGEAGVLPTGSAADLKALPITILPGFPTTLASGVDSKGNPVPVGFPFGIWFANSKTLYVCDEGDGNLVTPAADGNVADAPTLETAGVQKWKLEDGVWHMVYVLQNGLNIGVPYSVPDYPTALNPATDGCRNIAGRVNHNGTVTIFAVTSTVSAGGDQGADPNLLVKVTDDLDSSTLPTGDGDDGEDDSLGHFVVLRAAKSGEVLRGVSLAPVEREGDDRSDHDRREHDGGDKK
jgi:hypothetical protein